MWRDLIAETAVVPARLEVSPWVSAGGGARFGRDGSGAIPSLGAGIEATFGLGKLTDCWRDRTCSESSLRVGPWLAFESTSDRQRGEGGLALSWSGVATDSLSAFALDLGAGRANNGVNDVVARLSWGIRSVRMRTQVFHESGVCRAVVAPASGVGAYVAARQETGGAQAFEVTAGIELHPFGASWAITVHGQD